MCHVLFSLTKCKAHCTWGNDRHTAEISFIAPGEKAAFWTAPYIISPYLYRRRGLNHVLSPQPG